MKRKDISKKQFSAAQIAAAIAAAPKRAVDDPECPTPGPEFWDNAIVSRSLPELRAKLAARPTRGPNKLPTKEQVAVRYSAEVLAFFRSSGAGWQTRMDEVLRRYVSRQPRQPRQSDAR